MTTRTYMTPAKWTEVIEYAHTATDPIEEVARALGVSTSTVYRARNLTEPPVRKPRTRHTNGTTVTATIDGVVLTATPRPALNLDPEWEVEFTGTTRVFAPSIDRALAEARKLAIVRCVTSAKRV